MTANLPFEPRDLDSLREEAAGCTRCHLHRGATQTVFGAGPRDADLMLVGEQPGDREDLAVVQPAVVVLLGATAATALLGSSFRVTRQRGEVVERDGYRMTATVHPSSVLRAPDDRRQAAYDAFVADLGGVAALRP